MLATTRGDKDNLCLPQVAVWSVVHTAMCAQHDLRAAGRRTLCSCSAVPDTMLCKRQSGVFNQGRQA